MTSAKYLGFLTSSFPLASTKSMQPPFLWIEFSQPPPSVSEQTSYVHAPKGIKTPICHGHILTHPDFTHSQELFARHVFLPAIDLVTSPDYINVHILAYIQVGCCCSK